MTLTEAAAEAIRLEGERYKAAVFGETAADTAERMVGALRLDEHRETEAAKRAFPEIALAHAQGYGVLCEELSGLAANARAFLRGHVSIDRAMADLHQAESVAARMRQMLEQASRQATERS